MTDDDAMMSAIVKITNAYREGLLSALNTLRTTVSESVAANMGDYDAGGLAYSNGYLAAIDSLEDLLKVRA